MVPVRSMIEAYNIFCGKIRQGGTLVVNSSIRKDILVPEGVKCFTYGSDPESDFHAFDIEHHKDYYSFSIKTPDKIIRGFAFYLSRA